MNGAKKEMLKRCGAAAVLVFALTFLWGLIGSFMGLHSNTIIVGGAALGGFVGWHMSPWIRKG